MRNIFIATIIIVFCQSCDSDFTYHLPNNYIIASAWSTDMGVTPDLDWTLPTGEEKNGSYFNDHSYMIESYVYEVGWNEEYVYAKQHPLIQKDKNNLDEIDNSTVHYWIINTKRKEKRIGPLTKKEFFNKIEEIGIKDITFVNSMSLYDARKVSNSRKLVE